MSKKYYMVLDVETAGNVPFDVAYILTDRKGAIVDTYNALTAEVFNNPTARFMLENDQFMNKAKFAFYNAEPAEVVPFAEIADHLRNVINATNCVVVAYNAAFDFGKLNTYSRIICGRDFFPADCEVWDMWTMALYTLCASRNYSAFCDAHNLHVKDGTNRPSSAEAVYSFIASDPDFSEAHTALADCFIEGEILQAVFNRKKKLHTEFCGRVWTRDPWKKYLKRESA